MKPEKLLAFVEVQRLAYEACNEVKRLLRAGQSEKQVARLLDQALKNRGVKNFFHRSFAWFGERTCFDGMRHYLDFLPSDKALSENMAVILDTAPYWEGIGADVGLSFIFAPKAEGKKEFERAEIVLGEIRESIPKWVSESKTGKDLYQKVDHHIKKSGAENRHRRYPLGVLGHKMYDHSSFLTSLPGILKPFSWQAYLGLLKNGLFSETLTPNHRHPLEGLWAIEPHLRFQSKTLGAFGIKFEEFLFIEKKGEGPVARWADPERSLCA